MPRNIQPRGDLVLVRKHDDVEELTKGGLVVPDKAARHVAWATVVAIGPGHYLENGQRATTDLLPGDVVLVVLKERKVTQHNFEYMMPGVSISVRDRESYIVNQQDILAFVSEGDN